MGSFTASRLGLSLSFFCLALGALSDRSLGHRGLLLLSFVGAATAYAIVGWPGATFTTLVGSRVVVGLCKQTMTASTALVAVRTIGGIMSDIVKCGLIQLSNPINDESVPVADICEAMYQKHIPYIEEAGKKGSMLGGFDLKSLLGGTTAKKDKAAAEPAE